MQTQFSKAKIKPGIARKKKSGLNIFDKIYRRAKNNPKRIVLPEGKDRRVIKAAVLAARKNLARIFLLGEAGTIAKLARKERLNISGIEIINPSIDESLDAYAKSYWNLRKGKGVTQRSARDLLLQDYVYYGAMMVREGRADGFVAGASHKTSDVARAAFQCIERHPGHSTASGSFLIEVKDKQYGEDGLFLFADCGIVPLPESKQLVDIALSSAELWKRVTGYQPRLAMLSFSTKGSSSGTCVDKIRQAYEIVKNEKPDLIIDGELQVDSAIVPAVAKIKVPGSPLKGRANVLIFPNLDAGNIAYKLMQRLAQARVVGPIIQGLSKPCSDLSRGASSQEILDAIAVTAVRAQ